MKDDDLKSLIPKCARCMKLFRKRKYLNPKLVQSKSINDSTSEEIYL